MLEQKARRLWGAALKDKPASTSATVAASSFGRFCAADAASNSKENCRPIAAPICATSFASGPSRSRRARSEVCKVGGTDTGPPVALAASSRITFVSSSRNSGIPSQRSTIASATSFGSRASAPIKPFTSIAELRRLSRFSNIAVTAG